MNVITRQHRVYKEMSIEEAEQMIRDLESSIRIARNGQNAMFVNYGPNDATYSVFCTSVMVDTQ